MTQIITAIIQLPFYLHLLMRHLGLPLRHNQIQSEWNVRKAHSQSSLQCCSELFRALVLVVATMENPDSHRYVVVNWIRSFTALSARHGYTFESNPEGAQVQFFAHCKCCQWKFPEAVIPGVRAEQHHLQWNPLKMGPLWDPQESSHQISLPVVSSAGRLSH